MQPTPLRPSRRDTSICYKYHEDQALPVGRSEGRRSPEYGGCEVTSHNVNRIKISVVFSSPSALGWIVLPLTIPSLGYLIAVL